MRPIEFRGWSVKNKRWLYGFYQQHRGAHFICPDEFAVGKSWGDYEVKPESVGQFTSLKDRKGKNIYEGDIIRVEGIPERIEVRFVRGVFAFLWEGNLDDEFPTGSPTHEWAEVIGNMFEDPQFLRGKEQMKQSMIKSYENGYEAHWIDKHPLGAYYRGVDNSSGIVAFPEETIMLTDSLGIVVMFLDGLDDLGRIENKMNLVISKESSTLEK